MLTGHHKIQSNRIMEGESLNIIQDQLEKLKQLFPEAITEGKVDWEKLQATQAHVRIFCRECM